MLTVFCGVRTNQMVCGLMITAPTGSEEVARMAKPSAFLQRMEAKHRQDMRLQRLFTIQQCEDMMLITLGQDFGFGPKRAMEALDAFRETFRAFAQLCVEDAGGDQEIAYTKESIDRELRRIMGEGFRPWEERYPPEVFK